MGPAKHQGLQGVCKGIIFFKDSKVKSYIGVLYATMPSTVVWIIELSSKLVVY